MLILGQKSYKFWLPWANLFLPTWHYTQYISNYKQLPVPIHPLFFLCNIWMAPNPGFHCTKNKKNFWNTETYFQMVLHLPDFSMIQGLPAHQVLYLRSFWAKEKYAHSKNVQMMMHSLANQSGLYKNQGLLLL